MELQSVKRKVSQNKVVYSGTNEQSIEIDYILPDYYPDIFKIVKCIMCPNVVSVSTSGQRVSYDTDVIIKVLYVSPDDNNLRCIEQSYNYTKNIELDYNGEVNACICPKITYNSCRAVNERRISIRGTVGSFVTANAVNEVDILSEVTGGGVELKMQSEKILDDLISLNKRFSYNEEVILPENKDEIGCIYSVSAVIGSYDYKIIANKIILKAKANIEILYQSGNEIKNKTEQIQLSSIIDADGITDDHECQLIIKLNSCEYELISDENAALDLTLNCEAVCFAYTNDEIGVAVDAYSREYELECIRQNIDIYSFEGKIDDNLEVSTSIKIDDIISVDAIIVKLEDTPCLLKDSKANGSINVLVLGKNDNNEIVFSEKSSVFEYDTKIESDSLSGAVNFDIRSYSYTISQDGEIVVKTDLEVNGYAFSNSAMNVISDIQLGEEKPESNCGGIIIYYAEPGESVWEIAKRYNSSADAIMRENALENEVISKRIGLLIPMVF